MEEEAPAARSGGGLTMAARSLAVLAAAAALAAPALAAEPHLLGEFGPWAAWSVPESGKKLCYVYAEPRKEAGNYSKRGDTYIQVTDRPAAGTRNVVSVTAGYPYKKGSEVEIVVDGDKKFSLFTDGNTAWARDAKTDSAIVAAMRAGRAMMVRGTSSRGTLTTDTYSLNGVTAAHNAIAKACGTK